MQSTHAGNRSASTHAAKIDKIISDLKAAIDRTRPLADAEMAVGAVAAHRLILAAREALTELAELRLAILRDELASLPSISGGAPDDYEDIDPQFLSHPDEWPTYPHPEIDGWIWTTEPTPLSVLAADDPSAEWEPTPSAWDALEASWSEADQIALHGTW